MQTVDTPTKYVEGIFVQELKNRFLCEVVIEGVSTVCYVPSSCHLSNFLSLKGKMVLLVPIQSLKSRTKFALFAVKYKRSFILLNTSLANRAVEYSLGTRRFSFLGKRKEVLKEHTAHGYKADLYIADSDTIIEVKSVISQNACAIFPTVYSERTQKQLLQMQGLLKTGIRICFVIVSLSPYVKEIRIDQGTPFYQEFIKCIDCGMEVAAFSCRLIDGMPQIEKRLSIVY